MPEPGAKICTFFQSARIPWVKPGGQGSASVIGIASKKEKELLHI
jgi:hypothetical protein